MPNYATVEDYELRTGTTVPPDQQDTVQVRLDDTSLLIDVYLGDCQEAVAEKYPDVLTALTVSHVYRAGSVPVGIRSESVGGTSVSYDTDSGPLDLMASEATLLDALMDGVAGDSVRGIGQVGINYGGPEPLPDDRFGHWPDPDEVDIWVLAGRRRT